MILGFLSTGDETFQRVIGWQYIERRFAVILLLCCLSGLRTLKSFLLTVDRVMVLRAFVRLVELGTFTAVAEDLPAETRVPLPTGLFVTAEISGRALEDVYVLPLMALRDGDRVFVAEPDAPEDESGRSETDPDRSAWARSARLRVRDVNVVRRDRDRVVVDSGLESGDLVIVSPMRVYSENMAIRMVEADAR